MKEQNGIKLFEKTDTLPELPEGLTYDIPIISTFGFKIVEVDGKPFWQAATEDDFRAAESKRLGKAIPSTQPMLACPGTQPGSCGYSCPVNAGFCNRYYDEIGHYYYCACGYN